MKFIIHEPETAEGKAELADQAAAFHAKAVIDFINCLPCSRSEKLELIRQIKQNS